MSVKLAVFDCDGTLVDGQAGVVGAMSRAFARIGAPPPDPRNIRRIVGLSLPQAVRQLMMESREIDRQQVVEAYKQEFAASREDGSLREPLFDGMAELLRGLRDAGWTLGVATGKSVRGLANTLAVHGIDGLFTTLHTADGHPSKPHPAMLRAAMADAGAAASDTVMIGDTVFDMEMAANANCRAVGVAWGYHERDELLGAGATGVAADVDELEKLING